MGGQYAWVVGTDVDAVSTRRSLGERFRFPSTIIRDFVRPNRIATNLDGPALRSESASIVQEIHHHLLNLLRVKMKWALGIAKVERDSEVFVTYQVLYFLKCGLHASFHGRFLQIEALHHRLAHVQLKHSRRHTSQLLQAAVHA